MEGLALELGVEVVRSLLDSFMQQLKEQDRLIREAPDEVEEMEKDLMFLKEYVKDAVKNPKSNHLMTRTLIREVTDNVYKAEDAIDSFITEVAERKLKLFPGVNSKSRLSEIGQLISSVGMSVKKVRDRVEQQIHHDGHTAENQDLGECEVRFSLPSVTRLLP